MEPLTLCYCSFASKMTACDSAARQPPLDERPNSKGAMASLGVPDFLSIYEEHFDFVWSCARRLGVRPEVLDDIVQDVFIVIHGRLHTLLQPESLRSWIYGVVRRTVSNYHRARHGNEVAGTVVPDANPNEPLRQRTPLELAEHADAVRVLYSLLEELDETKREVFMLAELEEWTVPEIAEAIETPVSTVYSRLRAARIAFDEALTRYNAKLETGARPWRT
jgi:RNA polymerase sigma-70 factor, ECF subfamily